MSGLLNKKENGNKKKKFVIPKTVQQSIPYKAIYQNGIIEDNDGRFSKMYFLEDANFTIASQGEQEKIFDRYGEFLNMFSSEATMQINIFNRNVDKDKYYDTVLLKHKQDGLDPLRDEMNGILISKINEGKNNLVKEKYLTVSVKAEDVMNAHNTFSRLDTEISLALKKINDAETLPMSIEDRLAILYDIYNPMTEVPFFGRANIDGNGYHQRTASQRLGFPLQCNNAGFTFHRR